VTYVFDNSMAPRLAAMLRALGYDARALRDEFGQDAKDAEFLPKLKDRGWVFVTTDKHIRTKPPEAQALRESKVVAIFLRPFFAKMSRIEQAAWLVGHWERITGWARDARPGMCVTIQQNGKIERLKF
jgi:hypothetical protein